MTLKALVICEDNFFYFSENKFEYCTVIQKNISLQYISAIKADIRNIFVFMNF